MPPVSWPFEMKLVWLIDSRDREPCLAAHEDIGVSVVTDMMDRFGFYMQIVQDMLEKPSSLLRRTRIDGDVNFFEKL